MISLQSPVTGGRAVVGLSDMVMDSSSESSELRAKESRLQTRKSRRSARWILFPQIAVGTVIAGAVLCWGEQASTVVFIASLLACALLAGIFC